MQFQMKSRGYLLISVRIGWSFPCSKGRWLMQRDSVMLCSDELCHVPLPSTSWCWLCEVTKERDGIILSFSSNWFYCKPLFHGPFSENFPMKLSWSLLQCRGGFGPVQKGQMRALISNPPFCFPSCPCPSLILFIMSVELPLLWGWETQRRAVQGKWWRWKRWAHLELVLTSQV